MQSFHKLHFLLVNTTHVGFERKMSTGKFSNFTNLNDFMLLTVECHTGEILNQELLVLNCVETTVAKELNSAPSASARRPEILAIQNNFNHRGL